MRLVSDCLDWELMDGKSPLEKKINALLCYYLVAREGVPADECLSYACIIASLSMPVHAETIFKILWEAFGSKNPQDPFKVKVKSLSDTLANIVLIERKGK